MISSLDKPFSGAAAGAKTTQRRLKLAEWITDPRHPLSARVYVNRLWQHHFGRGLVSSPNNFGFNGKKPSHPELLDWLADEFVRGGWTVEEDAFSDDDVAGLSAVVCSSRPGVVRNERPRQPVPLAWHAAKAGCRSASRRDPGCERPA